MGIVYVVLAVCSWIYSVVFSMTNQGITPPHLRDITICAVPLCQLKKFGSMFCEYHINNKPYAGSVTQPAPPTDGTKDPVRATTETPPELEEIIVNYGRRAIRGDYSKSLIIETTKAINQWANSRVLDELGWAKRNPNIIDVRIKELEEKK